MHIEFEKTVRLYVVETFQIIYHHKKNITTLVKNLGHYFFVLFESFIEKGKILTVKTVIAYVHNLRFGLA